MISKPYFMQNKDWFYIDEDGNYVLTQLAPQKAINEYDQLRQKYIEKQKEIENKGIDEYLSIQEDDWLKFPL